LDLGSSILDMPQATIATQAENAHCRMASIVAPPF
jgi:hypothetical protein